MRCQRKQSVYKETRGGAVVEKLRGQINKTAIPAWPPSFSTAEPGQTRPLCSHWSISPSQSPQIFFFLNPSDCFPFLFGDGQIILPSPAHKWSKGVQVPSVCSEAFGGASVSAEIGVLCFAYTKCSWQFCILLSFTVPHVNIAISSCLPSLEEFHLVFSP